MNNQIYSKIYNKISHSICFELMVNHKFQRALEIPV